MKNLSIILCILLLFTGQVFAAVWKDDFEREELDADWTSAPREGNHTDWYIENGMLKGHWPLWNSQMLYVKGFNSIDYTIQVRCRIDKVYQSPDLAGAGIVFR